MNLFMVQHPILQDRVWLIHLLQFFSCMMLRYSFGLEQAARNIEMAIDKVLKEGYRTHDLEGPEDMKLNTDQISQKILDNLKS